MIVAGALALAACGRGGEEGAGAPNGDILANALVPADGAAAALPSAPVASWLGRWTGPEGLFLDVARHPGGFPRVRLTIKADLDSRGDAYLGHVEGGGIRFTRNGVKQTMRPGSGVETGFKWLADKKDCLIVVPGKEGYCRD